MAKLIPPPILDILADPPLVRLDRYEGLTYAKKQKAFHLQGLARS